MGNWIDKMWTEYESTYTSDEKIVFNPPEHPLVDNWMIGELKAIYEKMKTQKCDWFLTITGIEGAGKTSLAIAILWEWCKIVGLDFADAIKDNIAFDDMDVLHVMSAFSKQREQGISKRYYPWWFDEGANVFQNRDSHTSTRMIFLKYANAMRLFGRFIILCTPEFRQLDVYLREHRIKSLIRIERQGVYHYYDNAGMNKLTLFNKGVRDVHMRWSVAQYRHHGRFGYCESIDKVIENMKKQFFARLDMEIDSLYKRLLIKKLYTKYKMDEFGKEMSNEYESIVKDPIKPPDIIKIPENIEK